MRTLTFYRLCYRMIRHLIKEHPSTNTSIPSHQLKEAAVAGKSTRNIKITKQMWAFCLLAFLVLEFSFALSAAHHSRTSPTAFTTHHRCNSHNLHGYKNRQLGILASTDTSHEVTDTTTSSSATADDTSITSEYAADTGSTAIILNMNARSVTPSLISLASSTFGENNVFVTRTVEDATLAARTVVRGCSTSSYTSIKCDDEENDVMQNYALVIPVGGDGTLSGWIDTMVNEILLFDKLKQESEDDTCSSKNDNNETTTTTTHMSVEEAVQQLPLVGYIPMGTGNGLGYVIGCKANEKKSSDEVPTKKKSFLSKLNMLKWKNRHPKLERARQVMRRLKEVGDAIQAADQTQQQPPDDIRDVLSGKCSIVEMPLMEVTHPTDSTSDQYGKGDLCFFAGAGFDSLMLEDFKQVKAWSKTTRRAPTFIKDALSSVAGYCVALVTRTLPQTLWYGTHKIHVKVTTKDEDTLWVDHRRGDFSELAVRPKKPNMHNGEEGEVNGTTSEKKLVYSGSTGIIAASTTPFYGGGLRLFPYARLIPDKLQLRLGRISPLTGFFNIPSIFEGSYREKSERSFGCLDFIGKEFEVTVKSGKYEEYVKRKTEKKSKAKKKKSNVAKEGQDGADEQPVVVAKGFPFQHSGESMGIKEKFCLRVVQEPVKFISFLEPRVIVDD